MSQTVVGPVLFSYVWWVLQEAQREGIQCLYFLARDGYILREIALKFCERYHLKIECKYLYCSRASLRMPSYALIGDEAYDLLLLGGYYITPNTLLARTCLDSDTRAMIFAELGISKTQRDAQLSKSELENLSGRLRENARYRAAVTKNSKLAYPAAIGYLRQEGLLDADRVAIVDSGWTGSMQRSLRQLLQSAGFRGQVTGFYFGMFAAPKDSLDGTYHTWYFSHNVQKRRKVKFCNNLFECMLSAPHGMTLSYRQTEAGFIPLLTNEPEARQAKLIQTQITGILAYTEKMLPNLTFECFDQREALQNTEKILSRFMAHPTQTEAKIYGDFAFCDDVTEGYHAALADTSQLELLKGYSIPARILRKLCKIERYNRFPELFWPYGTATFAPLILRMWYRINIYAWEWLRYTLK